MLNKWTIESLEFFRLFGPQYIKKNNSKPENYFKLVGISEPLVIYYKFHLRARKP